MREMKFRAWNKETKEMIYFDFTNIYGYEGETCGVILPDEQTELNFNSGYGKHGINENLEIMQYTGLKDKDGKEIWENDVIISGCCKYVVKFGEYNSMWCSCECECNQHVGFYLSEGISDSCWDMELLHDDNLEVIGNIFDNSELLKESEAQ